MIKGLANLGLSSALGMPFLVKVIPKGMIGKVFEKIKHHYLDSGQYLREAMQEACEQTFSTLHFALEPGVWGKMTESKASKEFAEQFKAQYLEPYLASNPKLSAKRDAFCKEAAAICKRLHKDASALIADLHPKDEDVHEFFADGSLQHAEKRMNEGETELMTRIYHHLKPQEGDELFPHIIGLFRYQHTLFESIHYFFRLKIADNPKVKAIFDEMQELKILRQGQDAERQRKEIQDSIDQNNALLQTLAAEVARLGSSAALQDQRQALTSRQGELHEQFALIRHDVLQEAERNWLSFQRQFQGIEQRLGSQLQAAREDLWRLSADLKKGFQVLDEHLSRQDAELREMKKMLSELLQMHGSLRSRGADPGEIQAVTRQMAFTTYHGTPQGAWKDQIRREATQAGFQQAQVNELLGTLQGLDATKPLPPVTQLPQSQPHSLRKKVPHVFLEAFDSQGKPQRAFYIYFAPTVALGRHSSSDLVLYFYPLPDPPDVTNAEWKNWKGSGKCHPSLEISGHHADLTWADSQLWITDRSSKGTFVSRERLPKGQKIPLSEGAVIAPADVVSLSYSLLRSAGGQPIGWRLRRLNNYAGREEYLFLHDRAEITLGSDRSDGLLLQGKGVQAQHLRFRRQGDQLLLLPTSATTHAQGQPLLQPRLVTEGIRLTLGEQYLWAFPHA